MTREDVLAIIDNAYATRMRGDTAALADFWAEGATFEIAGEGSLIEAIPGAHRSPGKPAVEDLIGLVEMKGLERLNAVIEGNRATILSRAKVSFAGREPFDTVICDVFELDDDGKIRSLLEFADTAKIASEMQVLAQA